MPLAVPQRGGPGAAPAGGAAAAPAGGDGATTRGVSGPASPAGDTHQNPAGGRPAADRPVYRDEPDRGRHESPESTQGGEDEDFDLDSQAGDNPIPHSRVRKMIAQREARARQAAMDEMRQQLTPFLQEFQQLRQRADPRNMVKTMTDALARAAGLEVEEPPPQYVTRAEFEQMQRTERERAQAEYQQREDLQRAEVDLREAKVKHAKIFEAFPQLEDMAAAMWGSPWAMKNNMTLAGIIDGLVKDFNAAVGRVNEGYVADKGADSRQQVVAPAGGSAVPAAGARRTEYDLTTDEGTEGATRAFLRRNRGNLG